MVIATSTPGVERCDSERDRCLVQAHWAGDREAFAGIVELYHGMLLRQARRQLGDPLDAEDAVQDTLLRAYRGLDHFGARGDWRLGAWLTRIMANVCTDQRTRRAASARLTSIIVDEPPASDAGDLASDPVALAAVRHALGHLPSSQRQAFVLRTVDDLSYTDIADQLGITEDNARVRVQRARKALRHALDDVGAVARVFAAAPVTAAAALRAWRSAPRSPGHGRLAGDTAATSLRGTVASNGALASGSSAASSLTPAGSLSQIVGQIAATPAGQVAMSAATTTAGSGKSALTLGLAASVATAGALTLPPRSTPSTRHQAQTQTHVTGHAAQPQVSAAAATGVPGASAPDGASSTGAANVADTATSSASTSGGSGTSAVGAANDLSATVPPWVAAAAALTVAPHPVATGAVSPASDTSAATGTAATTGTTPAVPPAGGASAGGTTAGSGSPRPTTGTGVLPPGSCASVAGFPGVTAGANIPAIGTATIQSMLDTGAIDLSTVQPNPTFGTSTTLSLDGVSTGRAMQVAVGTCLATSGSTLAVDLTDAVGNEAQLVGSLLSAAPAHNPPGASGTAGATTGTSAPNNVVYLFSGVVHPYAGDSVDGALPWGLPNDFVAELQVDEPSNTAQLVVAFMQPTPESSAGTSGAPTATASGSPGAPISGRADGDAASSVGSGATAPSVQPSSSGATSTTPDGGASGSSGAPTPAG